MNLRYRQPSTRFLLSLICGVAFSLPPTTAQAASWIFGRSYYSHAPAVPVRIAQPRNVGGPYYSRPQGQFVNSGYRNLRSFINVQGQTVDQYMIYESWIQSGGQY